jgi:serine phosphatase RsbU (regulator of sigma subunit)
MDAQPWLAAAAVLCLFAALVWARAASRMSRAARHIEAETTATASARDAAELARVAYEKDLHAAIVYVVVGVGLAVASFSRSPWFEIPLLAIGVPVAISLRIAPRIFDEARHSENRTIVERRAEEVLVQQDLAPRRWTERLAPEELPVIDGFELGRVYEPGSGLMAGDFYDVYPTGPGRLACVIGDVAGHGVEPSITAFQVKYLLRNFLLQYRDPAQALEELNKVLSVTGRPEDMVSCCVVVFDTEADTLRHASAGHPTTWLWHDGGMRALRATGPLLTLDPHGTYYSKEVPLAPGDLLLLYTDGLAEARAGGQLFGEERIAQIVRRDPGQAAETVAKALLVAARDFSAGRLADDVAILVVRRN